MCVVTALLYLFQLVLNSFCIFRGDTPVKKNDDEEQTTPKYVIFIGIYFKPELLTQCFRKTHLHFSQ